MTPATNSPAPPSPSPPPAGSASPADVEASKALVLRYFEMWNTGLGSVADELLGPTYVEHAHPDFLGPAASRSLVPRVHRLFPGLVVSAEIVVASAEHVVVRTVLDPGDVDGHPDGPRRGMAMFRIADGRIVEQWSWYAPAATSRPAARGAP